MRIVILGGGISGLLAAYTLNGHHVTLVDAAPTLGGNYMAGGLKYIRYTQAFKQLLWDLKVPYRLMVPRGLLYANGLWHSHPEWLMGMDQYARQELQRQHWLMGMDQYARQELQRQHWFKTRGTHVGFQDTCMNDPKGEASAEAMLCDHALLITNLLNHIDSGQKYVVMRSAKITNIGRDSLVVDGITIPFDKLVATIPLAVLSALAPWANLPTAKPRPLTIVKMSADDTIAPAWEYMYTPTLPRVSRIVNHGAGEFSLEAPGPEAAASSCQDLVNEARPALAPFVADVDDGLHWYSPIVIPGHLPWQDPYWHAPDGWLLLGRFAEWDSRSTAEKVLDRIQTHAFQWSL